MTLLMFGIVMDSGGYILLAAFLLAILMFGTRKGKKPNMKLYGLVLILASLPLIWMYLATGDSLAFFVGFGWCLLGSIFVYNARNQKLGITL